MGGAPDTARPVVGRQAGWTWAVTQPGGVCSWDVGAGKRVNGPHTTEVMAEVTAQGPELCTRRSGGNCDCSQTPEAWKYHTTAGMEQTVLQPLSSTVDVHVPCSARLALYMQRRGWRSGPLVPAGAFCVPCSIVALCSLDPGPACAVLPCTDASHLTAVQSCADLRSHLSPQQLCLMYFWSFLDGFYSLSLR